MTVTEPIKQIYALALAHSPAEFAAAALKILETLIPGQTLSWQVLNAQREVLDRRGAMLTGVSFTVTVNAQGGVSHVFEVGGPPAAQAAWRELCEHLVAAEALCHEFAMRMAKSHSSDAQDPHVGMAVIGFDGRVQSADEMFHQHLHAAQSNWDGLSLPFTVEWVEELATHGMTWKHLFVRVDREAACYHLRVRKDRRTPELSQREFEIAERVAKGLTFKEIARELAVAPSTVSTHLYNLYDKLGFRRRAQLVTWLEQRRFSGQ